MPLTFSHPVAVLPLRKTPLNFSGLILGSMAPDFLYFFKGSASGHFGHTLPGFFLFCLPVSLLFYMLFHRKMKHPLYNVLPAADKEYLKATLVTPKLSATSLLILISSIAIGVFTHNFWDAFTHEHGFFVSRLPLLQQQLFTLLGREVTLYKLLQYGGHLLGVPILILYYLITMHKETATSFFDTEILVERAQFTGKAIVGCVVLTALAFLFTKATFSEGSFLGNVVVWSINFMVFATVIYSLIWQSKEVKEETC